MAAGGRIRRAPTMTPATVQLGHVNLVSPGSRLLVLLPSASFQRNANFAAKLEIHYTPKHGSWLNMAEIELSVLHRQCLNARIPDQHTLMQKIAAWQDRRNASASTVNWRFTTADARIKLESLYPSIENC